MSEIPETVASGYHGAVSPMADNPETKAAAALFDRNKAAIFEALAAGGVTRAVVAFDGYGDSGQVESIEFYAGDAAAPEPVSPLDYAALDGFAGATKCMAVSVATALENMAYAALGQTHCGWGNDEGSFGVVTFDVADRTVTLDYNERYTATENTMHEF